ncbi:MAG: 5'-nucleotidase, partial [Prevotellaceae bacterium]|nr:5'-nucleotidase [Prevotellaceae bacterium]
VIANDEAEKIYKERGIQEYHEYEKAHSSEELGAGPLADFFTRLSFFQKLETKNRQKDKNYKGVMS